MDVSVIIPFYNASAYVGRCLDGLARQDYAGTFEVLFVDNNSPDDTADQVRRYAAGDGRFRLLRESQQGAYAARNRALREAAGRWLAFTDPDCVPQPDWLTRLHAALEGRQVAVGASPAAGTDRSLRLMTTYEIQKDQYVFAGSDPMLYYGHTNNLATTREAMDACGPFIERRRGADTIFVRKVVDSYGTQAVVYAPDAVVSHLEIGDIATYFAKVTTYARSRRSYSNVLKSRPLTSRERLHIFRQAVRANRLGPVEAAHLFGLLVRGIGHWYHGAWTASRGPDAGKRTAADATPSSPSPTP